MSAITLETNHPPILPMERNTLSFTNVQLQRLALKVSAIVTALFAVACIEMSYFNSYFSGACLFVEVPLCTVLPLALAAVGLWLTANYLLSRDYDNPQELQAVKQEIQGMKLSDILKAHGLRNTCKILTVKEFNGLFCQEIANHHSINNAINMRDRIERKLQQYNFSAKQITALLDITPIEDQLKARFATEKERSNGRRIALSYYYSLKTLRDWHLIGDKEFLLLRRIQMADNSGDRNRVAILNAQYESDFLQTSDEGK